MKIRRFEQGPRYSEMTVVDLGAAKLVYISGQVAQDASLDIAGQTREVLGFIDRLPGEAGAGRRDIVSARVFLASVGDYAAMNEVWDECIDSEHTPARATVGAKLMQGSKVLIEVTAAIK
ncbi:MAG TPA: RidA family protein [Burkholderiaceae bacterium]|nr:RidA family protein [Burkholderiaceae bacterium]